MFVCDDLGPREIKGITHPVLTHRILGERVVESRFDAIRDGKLTQFVGRQRELQELLGLWKRANDGKGQIALLCGEPGIGKSRISNVVEDSIAEDPHITIRYQCSPHHTNSPFYPVIRQLERAARFERTDTPEVKLDKLEALLSKAGQTTLSDAETLCRFAIDSDERTLSGVGPRSATTEGPYDRCADPPAFRSRAHPAGAFLN